MSALQCCASLIVIWLVNYWWYRRNAVPFSLVSPHTHLYTYVKLDWLFPLFYLENWIINCCIFYWCIIYVLQLLLLDRQEIEFSIYSCFLFFFLIFFLGWKFVFSFTPHWWQIYTRSNFTSCDTAQPCTIRLMCHIMCSYSDGHNGLPSGTESHFIVKRPVREDETNEKNL